MSSSSSSSSRAFGRGFRNANNTCCIISLMQLVLHNPLLHDFLGETDQLDLLPTRLLFLLQEIKNASWSVDPKSRRQPALSDEVLHQVYAALSEEIPGLVWGTQVDAEELLTALLNVMQQDMEEMGVSFGIIPQWAVERSFPCRSEHSSLSFNLPILRQCEEKDCVQAWIEEEVERRCQSSNCRPSLRHIGITNKPDICFVVRSATVVNEALGVQDLPPSLRLPSVEGENCQYTRTGTLYFAGTDNAGHYTALVRSPGNPSIEGYFDDHRLSFGGPPPNAIPLIGIYSLEPMKSFDTFCQQATHLELEAELKMRLEEWSDGAIGEDQWAAWKASVRARVPSEHEIELERIEGLARQAEYREGFGGRGLDFIGSVLPTGSRVAGTAVGLAWPPTHGHSDTLTLDKWTTKVLLQKGMRKGKTFVSNLYEGKMDKVDHNRLPQPRHHPEDVARQFGYARQSPQHHLALAHLCRVSKQRNCDNLAFRANFPSLKLLQGLHQKHCLETLFATPSLLPEGTSILRGWISLSIGHLSSSHVPADLRTSLLVFAFVRSSVLLGVILVTAHGSQGTYGGGIKTVAQYESSVALDLTTNLLVELSGETLPDDYRWAYTSKTFPTVPVGAYFFEQSLSRLLEAEIRGHFQHRLCLFPVEWYEYLIALKINPSSLPNTSVLQTILALVKRSPNRQMGARRADDTDQRPRTTKTKTEEEILRSKEHRSTVNAKTAQAVWDIAKERAVWASRKTLEVLWSTTEVERLGMIKRRLESLKTTSIEKQREDVHVRILLRIDNEGFYSYIDHGAMEEPADTRLVPSGLLGQCMSNLEKDAMHRSTQTAKHPLEPWWCSSRAILFLRPTKREGTTLVLTRWTSSCLMCGEPFPQCRPIIGWQRSIMAKALETKGGGIGGAKALWGQASHLLLPEQSFERRIERVNQLLAPPIISRRKNDDGSVRLKSLSLRNPPPPYPLWESLVAQPLPSVGKRKLVYGLPERSRTEKRMRHK